MAKKRILYLVFQEKIFRMSFELGHPKVSVSQLEIYFQRVRRGVLSSGSKEHQNPIFHENVSDSCRTQVTFVCGLAQLFLGRVTSLAEQHTDHSYAFRRAYRVQLSGFLPFT